MCFSATASFAAVDAIGSIGLATLRHVREPQSLLFASVSPIDRVASNRSRYLADAARAALAAGG